MQAGDNKVWQEFYKINPPPRLPEPSDYATVDGIVLSNPPENKELWYAVCKQEGDSK
jgi:hypothetical protein